MTMLTYQPDSSVTRYWAFWLNNKGKKIEKRYYNKSEELQIITGLIMIIKEIVLPKRFILSVIFSRILKLFTAMIKKEIGFRKVF